MIKFTTILSESDKKVLLDKDSVSSAEAHRNKLTYAGRGYWKTPQGDTVAKTVNDKLVWLDQPHEENQPEAEATPNYDPLQQVQGDKSLQILGPTAMATQSVQKVGSLLGDLKDKVSPEVLQRLEKMHHDWLIAGERFKSELMRNLGRIRKPEPTQPSEEPSEQDWSPSNR